MRKNIAVLLSLPVLISYGVWYSIQKANSISKEHKEVAQVVQNNQGNFSPIKPLPTSRTLSSMTSHTKKDQSGSKNSQVQRSPAQQTSNDYSVVNSEKDFQNLYGSDWLFSKDSNGKIITIGQGTVNKPINNLSDKEVPVDIISFAKSIAPMLNIKEDQVSSDPAHIIASNYLSAYHLKQKIDDIEVYQGVISVFVSKRDKKIFSINNNLHPSNISLKLTDIRVSQDEAQNTVTQHFADQTSSDLKFVKGPVVFALKEPHQLAWIFSISVGSAPPITWEVVVGAVNGEIIHKQQLTIVD